MVLDIRGPELCPIPTVVSYDLKKQEKIGEGSSDADQSARGRLMFLSPIKDSSGPLLRNPRYMVWLMKSNPILLHLQKEKTNRQRLGNAYLRWLKADILYRQVNTRTCNPIV